MDIEGTSRRKEVVKAFKAFKAFGVTLTAVVVATVGFSVPAHAVTGDQGRVTARSGLVVRAAPTVHARSVGALRHGQIVQLRCKTFGTEVHGDLEWYRLVGSTGWVTGSYVETEGYFPRECTGDGTYFGRSTAGLNARSGPTTADAITGGYQRGSRIRIVCRLNSQPISGNPGWYYTVTGRWVSARYVAAIGATPHRCH